MTTAEEIQALKDRIRVLEQAVRFAALGATRQAATHGTASIHGPEMYYYARLLGFTESEWDQKELSPARGGAAGPKHLPPLV